MEVGNRLLREGRHLQDSNGRIWMSVGATVAILVSILMLVVLRKIIKAKREIEEPKNMRRTGERNIREQGAKGEPDKETAPRSKISQEDPLAIVDDSNGENGAVREKNQSRVGNHSPAKGTREPSERGGVSRSGTSDIAPSPGRDNSNVERRNSPKSTISEHQAMDEPLKGPEAGQGGVLNEEPRAVPLKECMTEQPSLMTPQTDSESRSVHRHTPDHHDEANAKPTAKEFEDLPLRRAPTPSRSSDSSVAPSQLDASKGSRVGPQPARATLSEQNRSKSSDAVPDGPPIRRPPGPSHSVDGHMSDQRSTLSSDRDNSNAGRSDGLAFSPRPPPSHHHSLLGPLKDPKAGQGEAFNDPRAMPLEKHTNGQHSPAAPQPGSKSRSVSFRTPESHRAKTKPRKQFENYPVRRAPAPSRSHDSSSTSSQFDASKVSRTRPQPVHSSDAEPEGPPIRRPRGRSRSFDGRMSDQKPSRSSDRCNPNTGRTNSLASSPRFPPSRQHSLLGPLKGPEAGQGGALNNQRAMPSKKYINGQQSAATPYQPGSESRRAQHHNPDLRGAKAKPTKPAAKEFEDLPLRRAPTPNRSIDSSVTPRQLDTSKSNKTRPQSAHAPPSKQNRSKLSDAVPDGPPIRRPPGPSHSVDGRMSDQKLARSSDHDNSNTGRTNGLAFSPRLPPSQVHSLLGPLKDPEADQGDALNDPQDMLFEKCMTGQQSSATPYPNSESRNVSFLGGALNEMTQEDPFMIFDDSTRDNDAIREVHHSRVGNHSIAKDTRQPNERDGVSRSGTSDVAPSSGRDNSNVGRTNGTASTLSEHHSTEEPLKGPETGQGAALNEEPRDMAGQQSSATPQPNFESRNVSFLTPGRHDSHKATPKPTKELEDLPLRSAATPTGSFDSSLTQSRSDAAEGSRAGPRAGEQEGGAQIRPPPAPSSSLEVWVILPLPTTEETHVSDLPEDQPSWDLNHNLSAPGTDGPIPHDLGVCPDGPSSPGRPEDAADLSEDHASWDWKRYRLSSGADGVFSVERTRA